MKSKLFILIKSPHESVGAGMIPKLAGEGRRGALLFEDAVLFSVVKEEAEVLLGKVDEAYVISDDLEARGLSHLKLDGFEMVDYSRAVELIMEEFDQTITV